MGFVACSTIVEYSQQEGFYRVPLPAARQTSNLEDQWLERSNSRHQVSPRLKRRERTPAAEGGTMGEKFPRILPKVATSTSLLVSFTCRKFTTWDRRFYFPSEGRRAKDFFARKIRRLRPGLNSRTRVPEASTLTSIPPKSYWYYVIYLYRQKNVAHVMASCFSTWYAQHFPVEISAAPGAVNWRVT